MRAVSDQDLARALEIEAEYVGMGIEKVSAWRNAQPEWFRGAYLDNELVGICCGVEHDGAVILQSIAVLFDHWRKGIGTRLLRDFEKIVFGDTDVAGISLGSADDAPTERFYLKNGYRAKSVMLTVRRDVVPPPKEVPHPERVRVDGENQILYFAIDEYEPARRDELVALFGAKQGLFIFEKVNPATDESQFIG